MAKLEISTTIGCPMRCSICPQDTIESVYTGPRLMSVETFAAALSHAPDKIPVSFAGYAEPYLNRECSAMVALAAARGHPIQVYTTGAGMSDADVELLIRLQPYTFVLHAPDAEGDMKLRVTPAYVERVKRLADGVKAFRVVCHGSLPDPLQWAAKFMNKFGLVSRAGNVTHLPQIRKSGSLKCKPDEKLENHVLIPSGTLISCCNDYSLSHPLGNLLVESWDEIQEGPAMAEFKRSMQDGSSICGRCEYAVPA